MGSSASKQPRVHVTTEVETGLEVFDAAYRSEVARVKIKVSSLVIRWLKDCQDGLYDFRQGDITRLFSGPKALDIQQFKAVLCSLRNVSDMVPSLICRNCIKDKEFAFALAEHLRLAHPLVYVDLRDNRAFGDEFVLAEIDASGFSQCFGTYEDHRPRALDEIAPEPAIGPATAVLIEKLGIDLEEQRRKAKEEPIPVPVPAAANGPNRSHSRTGHHHHHHDHHHRQPSEENTPGTIRRNASASQFEGLLHHHHSESRTAKDDGTHRKPIGHSRLRAQEIQAFSMSPVSSGSSGQSTPHPAISPPNPSLSTPKPNNDKKHDDAVPNIEVVCDTPSAEAQQRPLLSAKEPSSSSSLQSLGVLNSPRSPDAVVKTVIPQQPALTGSPSQPLLSAKDDEFTKRIPSLQDLESLHSESLSEVKGSHRHRHKHHHKHHHHHHGDKSHRRQASMDDPRAILESSSESPNGIIQPLPMRMSALTLRSPPENNGASTDASTHHPNSHIAIPHHSHPRPTSDRPSSRLKRHSSMGKELPVTGPTSSDLSSFTSDQRAAVTNSLEVIHAISLNPTIETVRFDNTWSSHPSYTPVFAALANILHKSKTLKPSNSYSHLSKLSNMPNMPPSVALDMSPANRSGIQSLNASLIISPVGIYGQLRSEFPLGSSILLTSLVVNPHSLAILCLDEHELGPKSGLLLEALVRNTQTIEILSLKHNQLGSALLNLSHGIASNTSLRALSLASNRGGPNVQAILTAVADHPRLVELDLSDNSAGEECVIALANMLRQTTTLHTLNFSLNRVGSAMGQIADALGANTTISNLDLSSNLIGDQACIELAAGLGKSVILSHLNLSKCLLSDKSALALQRAVSSSVSLASMTFESGNQISARASNALCRVLSLNAQAKVQLPIPPPVFDSTKNTFKAPNRKASPSPPPSPIANIV